MANFSVNKVNQFYVATKLKTDGAHLKVSDGVGTIAPFINKKYHELSFEYVSPGGVIRSDRIDLHKVTNMNVTDATKCRRPLKVKRITLADLNGSAAGNATVEGSGVEIIPGESYIFGLEFIHYIGMSDQDKYYVTAAVQGMPGMKSSEFYVRMAYSIARNLSREPAALVDIYLAKDDTDFNPVTDVKVEISPAKLTDSELAKAIATNTAIKGIIIKERILDNYEQGIGDKKPIDFVFVFDEICYNSVDMKWGYETDMTGQVNGQVFDGTNFETALVMGNGRTTADMEYFYMGERGDQERHSAWPNNFPTKYLCDPNLEYSFLTMNFYWSPGDNDEGVRSTKVINIVAPQGSNILNGILNFVEENDTAKTM